MADSTTPDDDELAALYREGDGDVEPPEAWASLRDVISAARDGGFDEEPPARIDALLMAAAKQHAPRPRVSLWSRATAWLRPTLAHPALAAAAALLVVGGAAGVMYSRSGRLPVAEPPRSAAVESVAEVQAPTAINEQEERVAPEPPPPPLAPVQERQQNAAESGAVVPAPRTPPRPRPGHAGGGGAGAPGATSAGLVAPPTDDAIEQAGGEAGAVEFSDKVVPDPAVTQARGDKVTIPQPPPPPPPPPPNGGAAPDDSSTTGADRGPTQAANDLRPALLDGARLAAQRGDCSTVRALAERVRALDPAYYRTTFATDRALAACLAPTIAK